ncbi:MAG: radical SAM/SPASM domain-containing protein [Paludibacter sp.]|nr:radical SAM/SPASM domain-containing protein [Paludibacter sp.]
MKLHYIKSLRLFKLTNYLSILKITNWLKLIFSYLYSSVLFLKNRNIYPHFISIETSNFCNLHCPECPVGKNSIPSHDKSTFKFELFKKLIDELKPTLQHVILYFQGEPFLCNQLMEFIKYTHESGIYSSTSTNGQFLNKKIAREIVLSGLDKLIVSIDGTTQDVYETYRVGGNLQKTLVGINNIVEWKKELKSITPLVEIQFLVLKNNEHQMTEMKMLAKSLSADRLTFKSAQLYDFEKGSDLLTTKDRYARYKRTRNGQYKIKGRQPNRCWRMWSGAVINVHGEVLPCCFDKSSEHSFGNINEQSFLDCWQSSKANNFRSRIINNRMQFDMCRNCTS